MTRGRNTKLPAAASKTSLPHRTDSSPSSAFKTLIVPVMDMKRRSGLDRGLKDAQGPACGVLRRLQARIVRQPRARRDDISSQEIGHGHMMTPRLVWVWLPR